VIVIEELNREGPGKLKNNHPDERQHEEDEHDKVDHTTFRSNTVRDGAMGNLRFAVDEDPQQRAPPSFIIGVRHRS